MACYYSGAGNGNQCYSLYSKERLAPDIELIHNQADEIVNKLGQKIDYYVSTFSPLCADNTYGEDPTSVFWGPKQMKMVVELNESSLSLGRIGFGVEDEVTGYFTIRGFARDFENEQIHQMIQQEVAPKSGDIFQMTEYGNDRVGERGGNFFEITERRDQDISSGQMNPLGGHYLWRIRAKRLDYSFQPGISGERGNDQVYDNTFSGILSSFYGENPYDYIPNDISGSTLSQNISSFVVDQLSGGNYIPEDNDILGGLY